MRNRFATGFTAIELMVTVAIAAILLSLAAPSFSTFIVRNRVATQSNELVTALTFARFEAVRRGTRVAVCRSAPVTSGVRSCADAGGWEQGWIVFLDPDANGDPGVAADILREQAALPTGFTVNGADGVEVGIAFIGTGLAAKLDASAPFSVAPAASNGEASWTICPSAGRGTAILINVTGRSRRADAACS